LKSIPFTRLRESFDEIPRGEPLLVVCPRGSRSSEAVRILKQNGFEDVRYVGGGMAFFNA
jgi:rhodanese-related sulfurtransferase